MKTKHRTLSRKSEWVERGPEGSCVTLKKEKRGRGKTGSRKKEH